MPAEKTRSRLHPRFHFLFLLAYLFSAPVSAAFVTTLSATHVQTVLQMHFPLRDYATTARVSLHEPEVRLTKGADNMTLMIPVEVNIPGEDLRHGHAMVTVSLNYKASTGEVFLHDPHLQQLEIPHVAEDMKQSVAATVANMTAKALPLVRIYTVREHDLNHSLDKSALKSATVEDDRLQLEFGFR